MNYFTCTKTLLFCIILFIQVTAASHRGSSESGTSHVNVIPVTMQDLQQQCQPFSLYTHNIHYPPSSGREGSLPPSSVSPPLSSPAGAAGLTPMEFSLSYDLDFPPLLKSSCSSSSLGSGSPVVGGGGDLQPFMPSPAGSQLSPVGQGHPPPVTSKMTYFLERAEIGRLNDLDYNRMLCKALERIRLGLDSARDFAVMDMSRGISVLPLQAVKLGAQEVCVLQDNVTNQELLCYLTTANSIDPNRVTFSAPALAPGESVEHCDAEWGVLVIGDVVEGCGCLRQQVLEDIALARSVKRGWQNSTQIHRFS